MISDALVRAKSSRTKGLKDTSMRENHTSKKGHTSKCKVRGGKSGGVAY